jgi:hypothetical protein
MMTKEELLPVTMSSSSSYGSSTGTGNGNGNGREGSGIKKCGLADEVDDLASSDQLLRLIIFCACSHTSAAFSMQGLFLMHLSPVGESGDWMLVSFTCG